MTDRGPTKRKDKGETKSGSNEAEARRYLLHTRMSAKPMIRGIDDPDRALAYWNVANRNRDEIDDDVMELLKTTLQSLK